MSALAKFCLKKGMAVSGSDSKKNEQTKILEKLGAKIFIGHRTKNIASPDIVVYTGAIKADNVERIACAKKEITQIERSEFLSLVARQFKNVIAISGTHGKTTTTALIARCFILAGLNPCVHLGGECEFVKGNFLYSEGDYFITEACEYRKSFLCLKPTCSVVLNCDYDHIECYKDEKELKSCFRNFLNVGKVRVCPSGFSKSKCVTFSFDKKADYVVKNIIRCKNKQSFDVFEKGVKLGNFELKLIGDYNILNVLACVSVCRKYNLPVKVIQRAVASFSGVKRRFEKVGSFKGYEVVKDYAHHPTEIAALLKAFSEIKNEKLVVVFQPHTYKRTEQFFNKFVSVLSNEIIDKLIIFPTYAAREKKIKGAEAKDLFKELNSKRRNVYYCSSYRKIKKLISQESGVNASLLVVGAGDIEKLCNYLVK